MTRPIVIKWWHVLIAGLGVGSGVTRSVLDEPEGCVIDQNKSEITITCNDR